MKKTLVAVLLALVCASPAFAWHHKRVHKDPRVVEHPRAIHEKNPHLQHPVKHKMPKHKNS